MIHVHRCEAIRLVNIHLLPQQVIWKPSIAYLSVNCTISQAISTYVDMITHYTQSEEMQVRTVSLILRPFAPGFFYQKLWGTVIYLKAMRQKSGTESPGMRHWEE